MTEETMCDVCNRERPCTEDEVTGDLVCQSCRDNAAEAAWERQQEEPTFRGNEYEAHLAREMAEARKLK
jgi:ribosomal protein L37AE/L43A